MVTLRLRLEVRRLRLEVLQVLPVLLAQSADVELPRLADVLPRFVLFGLGSYALVRLEPVEMDMASAAAGVVLAVAGLLIVTNYSRCPDCGELLHESRGLVMNPASCPSCGVAVR